MVLAAAGALSATPARAQVACAGSACPSTFDGTTQSITFKDSGDTQLSKLTAPVSGALQVTDVAGTNLNRIVFGDATLGVALHLRQDLNYLRVVDATNSTYRSMTAQSFYLRGEGRIEQVSDGVLAYKNSAGNNAFLMGGGSNVASATPLPVPVAGVYHVTGTTGFNTITATGLVKGVEVSLIFDGALTVTTGTGNLRLAGAANFTSSADDVLTLIYDGTNWYEKCRSVN